MADNIVPAGRMSPTDGNGTPTVVSGTVIDSSSSSSSSSSTSTHDANNSNNNHNNKNVVAAQRIHDDVIVGQVITAGVPGQPGISTNDGSSAFSSSSRAPAPLLTHMQFGRAPPTSGDGAVVVGVTSSSAAPGGRAGAISSGVRSPGVTIVRPGDVPVRGSEYDFDGSAYPNGSPHQLPASVQAESDLITAVTLNATRLRVFWAFECIICIFNGVSMPYMFIALPFAIVGYISARWLKYYAAGVAMLFALFIIPMTFADFATISKFYDGFVVFFLIFLGIVWCIFHSYTAYLNFIFMREIKILNDEQRTVCLSTPAVCGCL